MKVTEVIVEALTNEEFVGFCKGEAIISMADGDLEKARGYIDLAMQASEPDEPKEEPKEEPKKKRKPIDHGKIMALHRAGWSVAKIADEMRVSDQTVRNHIQQEAQA